ncbi:MAG TPA: MFS transporter [Nitrolancea sp.]|nr:MFS transporter [Nitrolancea sp.]
MRGAQKVGFFVALPWYLQNRVLRAILIVASFAGISVGLVIPFLTLTARERGISLGAIGIMASSYLVAQMLLQLPLGALSDRVGRVGPLAVGLLVEALATASFTFADSAPTFILARVGQGVGVAILYPSFRAMIADVTPANRRGQAYAVVGAAFSGGMLFGPPIGGMVATIVGVNWLFLTAGGLEVIVAFSTLFTMRRLVPREHVTEEKARVPFRELISRPLAGAFILGFAGQFQFGLFSGIWSIYLKDLSASDFQIGLSFSTFSVTFMLLAPFMGRLADHSERWRRILVANLLYAVVIALYGLIENVPFILVLGLVEGAIVSFTQPVADAYLASIADPRVQGRVQGAYVTIGMAGAAISALLGSVLYGIAPVVPFLVGGAVMAALTVVAVYFVRETEQRMTLSQTTHRRDPGDQPPLGANEAPLTAAGSHSTTDLP